MSEPISPELVLVDPELARAERARLLERDRRQTLADLAARSRLDRELPAQASAAHVRALEAQVETLRVRVRALEGEVHALEAQVPAGADGQRASERRRKRAASIVLPISLIANAVLIAVAVADSRVGEPSSVPPTAVGTTRQELVPRVPRTSVPKPSTSKPRTRRAKKSSEPPPRKSAPTRRTRRHSAVVRRTVGAVERKVLAVVVQSPAGKLPPRLINRKTGLAKNGLQAICRRSGTHPSFLCIVRPAHHKPTEGLYVRYRRGRNGRGVLTWYPYRSR